MNAPLARALPLAALMAWALGLPACGGGGGSPAVAPSSLPTTGLAPPDQARFDSRYVGMRATTPLLLDGYLDFVSAGRFRDEDSYSGSYTYTRTGPDAGTLNFLYDDGDRCTLAFTLTSASEGAGAASCVGGGAPRAIQFRIGPIPPPPGSVPDLAVGPVSADSSPSSSAVGADTTLSATVSNLGGAQAAATTLRWYRFRADGPHPTRVDEVGADPVAALAALGARSESIVLSAPQAPGIYSYFACVGSVAGESNTANNCSYNAGPLGFSATLGGDPDLLISSFDASTPVAGDSFTLSATVSNLGGVQAAATTLRWSVFSDDTLTDVGTDPVEPLAAFVQSGDMAEAMIDLPSPEIPGIHYYVACVGPVAGESYIGNNCGYRPVVVFMPGGPLDLVVVAASSPSLSGLNPRGFFVSSAAAVNLGSVQAAATTLRWYRSSDASVSASDTEVAAEPVAALAPGGLGGGIVVLSAPESPGTYHYGACVDSVVGELSAANNCSGGAAVVVVDPI